MRACVRACVCACMHGGVYSAAVLRAFCLATCQYQWWWLPCHAVAWTNKVLVPFCPVCGCCLRFRQQNKLHFLSVRSVQGVSVGATSVACARKSQLPVPVRGSTTSTTEVKSCCNNHVITTKGASPRWRRWLAGATTHTCALQSMDRP